MIKLTPEEDNLLDATGNVLVLGGPGSGKTTISLLKAHREIETEKLKPGQRILFLSFARATVTRVAEQAGKIISDLERRALEINTYHGFTWNLIRSHGYLLDTASSIRLLPPPEAASRLSEIKVGERKIEQQRLFKQEGLLHFDLFAQIATSLLSNSKALRRIICDSYPIIILDEFQDTNSDEWELIKILGMNSRLIALADAEQRIYEFRGADPKRIGEFITDFNPIKFDYGFLNRRSAGTDIAIYGNDLLTGANKTKTYKDVGVVRYGFYRGRSPYFSFKASVIQAIKRQIKSEKTGWSIAVLVPSRRLMLKVSDYLSSTTDNLPSISHDVALDAEGPSLSAVMIAGLLELEISNPEMEKRMLRDLCIYIRGRKSGRTPTQIELKLLTALDTFLQTGKIRGTNRQRIVDECHRIIEERRGITLSGDPAQDWLTVRRLLENSTAEEIREVANDAKYLRLLHKGALLSSRLSELWRRKGSYVGAASSVRDALLQEHFSLSTKVWRGVHVMTIHKAKGKEFDEVIIYEGAHDGRIVRDKATSNEVAQARLALRVAVTRAMKRATILTPASEPCIFL